MAPEVCGPFIVWPGVFPFASGGARAEALLAGTAGDVRRCWGSVLYGLHPNPIVLASGALRRWVNGHLVIGTEKRTEKRKIKEKLTRASLIRAGNCTEATIQLLVFVTLNIATDMMLILFPMRWLFTLKRSWMQ
jgi:hypothetical protein